MKITNNINNIKTYKEQNIGNTLGFKQAVENTIYENKKDLVQLSMSGKNRSQRLTVPIAKKNSAGLIIIDLETSQANSAGYGVTTSASIATVSNEKAARGASENRLGGNSRNIDNPKELLEKIRPAILKKPRETILAQGNSQASTVMHLLK